MNLTDEESKCDSKGVWKANKRDGDGGHTN